jgi:hypothetical protein
MHSEHSGLGKELNAVDPDPKVPLFVASAGLFECLEGHH